NPLQNTNYVQVVRAVNWNDATYLQSGVQATVGTQVTDPRGITTNKSGFVIFPNTPIDSVGPNAAYARSTQTGPIIPVNVPLAGVDSNLVVAFYAPNPTPAVLWPEKPGPFDIAWPSAPEKIVIANPAGTLAPYAEKLVYSQPDPNQPG